jgi:hypothetical protein
MDLEPSPSFIEARWFISHMNCCATGEGGGIVHRRRRHCRARRRDSKEVSSGVLPPDFGDWPIHAMASDYVTNLIQWIPDPAIAILKQLPRGAGHYFTKRRYNLS